MGLKPSLWAATAYSDAAHLQEEQRFQLLITLRFAATKVAHSLCFSKPRKHITVPKGKRNTISLERSWEMFSEYLRVLGRIKQGHLYSKSSLSRPVLQSVYLCGKENQRKEWKSLDSYACVNPVKMLMALRCISPALAGGWRKWVCPRIPHTWQNLTSAVTTI